MLMLIKFPGFQLPIREQMQSPRLTGALGRCPRALADLSRPESTLAAAAGARAALVLEAGDLLHEGGAALLVQVSELLPDQRLHIAVPCAGNHASVSRNAYGGAHRRGGGFPTVPGLTCQAHCSTLANY